MPSPRVERPEPPDRLRLTLALAFSFPVLAFLLLRLGVLPDVWFGLPDAGVALGLGMGLLTPLPVRVRIMLALGGIVLLGVGLWLQPTLTLALIPAAVNLMLARMFHLTLAPGNEALISRIARLARGETGPLAPALATYTRRLTAAWAGLFVALALQSVLLAVWADQSTVWLFANTLNLWLMAGFFIAEHIYRRHRFSGHPRTPLGQVLRTLIAHGWKAPDVVSGHRS